MTNWMPLILLIFGTLFSTIVGLQAWILKQLYDIHGQISGFQQQMGRIVSDIESEKDTMKRRHIDFDKDIRGLLDRVTHLEVNHESRT